jgi:hypothetical protein
MEEDALLSKDARKSEIVLIGTDHRLQNGIKKDPVTQTWIPRRGGSRYRRLISFCINKRGVTAILEEAHANQEDIYPTIASSLAKAAGIAWKAMGLGAPDFSDGLVDPPFAEAMRLGIAPVLLAGIYNLSTQQIREEFMRSEILNALTEHRRILAIVGYVHLGVLARMLEKEDRFSVTALLFTDALVLDEDRS